MFPIYAGLCVQDNRISELNMASRSHKDYSKIYDVPQGIHNTTLTQRYYIECNPKKMCNTIWNRMNIFRAVGRCAVVLYE